MQVDTKQCMHNGNDNMKMKMSAGGNKCKANYKQCEDIK